MQILTIKQTFQSDIFRSKKNPHHLSFKFDQIDLTVNVVHFDIIPLIMIGVTHVLLHPVDKSV